MEGAAVATVAHSLLASVTVISGVIDLVRTRWDDFDEQDQHRLLSLAHDHVTRLAKSLDALGHGAVATALAAARPDAPPVFVPLSGAPTPTTDR